MNALPAAADPGWRGRPAWDALAAATVTASAAKAASSRPHWRDAPPPHAFTQSGSGAAKSPAMSYGSRQTRSPALFVKYRREDEKASGFPSAQKA